MTAEEAGLNDAERHRVEAEFLERMQREALQLTVADHLVNILRSLSGLAFLHLGITEDTAKTRDLDQSRLAIDAFRALTDLLAGVHPAEEVNLYRSTLSQMQLAYVSELERERQATGAGETPPAQTATSPAEETEKSGEAQATSEAQANQETD